MKMSHRYLSSMTPESLFLNLLLEEEESREANTAEDAVMAGARGQQQRGSTRQSTEAEGLIVNSNATRRHHKRDLRREEAGIKGSPRTL
jgi:hypothetical protein